MGWETVPGWAGKVYVPQAAAQDKKNRCADCFVCQQCGDERCAVCGAAELEADHLKKKCIRASAKEVIHEKDRLCY
jgi:hypothetical protein